MIYLRLVIIIFWLAIAAVGCHLAPKGAPPRAVHALLSGDAPEVETHQRVPGTLRGLEAASDVIAFMSNEYGVSLVPVVGGVRIDASERSPVNGIHYTWNAIETTSYEVQALCARHSLEYYVYGLAADGSAVLERWDREPWLDGAYYTVRGSSLEPIGIPVRSYQTLLKYKGSFVLPSQRSRPPVRRTPVALPAGLGSVSEMAVDPEGRFILLRVADAQGSVSLKQLEFSSGNVGTVASDAAMPQLATTTRMRFMDATGTGRVLVMRTSGLDALVLIDENNDGVFQAPVALRLVPGMQDAFPEFTRTYYP